MKTINEILLKTLILSIFLAITIGASAQKNSLQIRPFTTKISFEHMVTPNISVGATGKIFPVFLNLESDNDKGSFRYNNFSVAPEVRFYLSKKNENRPEGFYLAPFIKMGLVRVKTTTRSNSDLEEKAKFKGSSFSSGFVFGWQWITHKKFTIGTSLGWAYTRFNLGDLKVTYSDGTTETETFDNARLEYGLPVFRFSLGYAF